MLHRNFKQGEELDVAGLNKIIVLVDRSETEITEIGLNEWRPKLDGPPHKHGDKDQVFYITSGVGKVKLGNNMYDVKEGSCVYVPAGLTHQTITTGEEPLCYMLFNIFASPDSKEGHGSFAEHIEKVKQIRKQQAESGSADVTDKESEVKEVKESKFYANIFEQNETKSDTYSEIKLLDRNETNGFEFIFVKGSADYKKLPAKDSKKEQTVFILTGKCKVKIDNEEAELKKGDVVFIPRNKSFECESLDQDLKYLFLDSFVVQ